MKMKTIIELKYTNTKNNGVERVKKTNEGFFISSNYAGIFTAWVKVTESQLIECLNWTQAPKSVFDQLQVG